MICPHCQAPLGVDARFCPACGRALSTTETVADSSSPAIPVTPSLIGRDIAGRFRVLAKLGEGGMGAVYRAEQISLKRAVAVKLLRPELSQNQMIVRRFSAEAEAVAKLDHPNTVKVYDFGQDTTGALFIAMEFVEGGSLRTAMATQGPLPPARALAIAAQVAASLADAHALSIIHRDLKPDNVMLQDKGRQRDNVRVLDFGIAKLRDDQRSTQQAMTQAGDMLGTPQYMSPEQIRGEHVDGRTDVYALGCMIYEMVTGRLPFEGPSVLAILTKHLTEVVVPPSQRRPDLALPGAIDQVVMAAMAKEPASRPATMERYGELIAGALAIVDPARGTPSAPFAAVAPIVATPTPIPPTVRSNGPSQPSGYVPIVQLPGSLPPGTPMVPITPPAMAQMPALAHMQQQQLAPPRPRNYMPVFVVLALIGIGGAGVGVYLATHKDKPGETNRANDTTIRTAPPHDNTSDVAIDAGAVGPDPWAGKSDPWESNGGAKTPAPQPPPQPAPQPQPPPRTAVTTPPAPPPRTTPTPAPTPTTAQVSSNTAFSPIPAGMHLNVPNGFTQVQSSSTGQLYGNAQGIAIGLGPLLGGTNDPQALASAWVKEMNGAVTLASVSQMMSKGKMRPMLVFSGKINNVMAVQMIILYIEDTYRVGMLIQIPVTAGQQSGPLLGELLLNGITLP